MHVRECVRECISHFYIFYSCIYCGAVIRVVHVAITTFLVTDHPKETHSSAYANSASPTARAQRAPRSRLKILWSGPLAALLCLAACLSVSCSISSSTLSLSLIPILYACYARIPTVIVVNHNHIHSFWAS